MSVVVESNTVVVAPDIEKTQEEATVTSVETTAATTLALPPPQTLPASEILCKTEIFDPFKLDSGKILKNATVGYQTWGKLNDDGTNAVVVCHSLTGGTDADVW